MGELTEIRIIVAGAPTSANVADVTLAICNTVGGHIHAMTWGAATPLDPPSDGQETFRCQHSFRWGVANKCIFCGDRP